jgi:hypothetical protein
MNGEYLNNYILVIYFCQCREIRKNTSEIHLIFYLVTPNICTFFRE